MSTRSAARSPQTGPRTDSPSSEPEALVISHYIAPDESGEALSADLTVYGKRSGVAGGRKASDSFVHVERLEHPERARGPIAVTSRIYGLSGGDWSVSAEVLRDAPGSGPSRRRSREQVPTARWSWRHWQLQPGPSRMVVRSRWSPLAMLIPTPAVLPGTLPVLVALGAVALVLTQFALLPRSIAPASAALVTIVSALAGLFGAKLWYFWLHPQARLLGRGWAVDGFLVAAPIVAVGLLLVTNTALLVYLDATTPGLFLTVGLGRLGCFLTGCCAGRLTGSRFGVVCSDGRLIGRRVPAQLLESAVGFFLAAVTLAGSQTGAVGTGLLFFPGLALYLAARTLLLRYRAERRRFLWERAETP